MEVDNDKVYTWANQAGFGFFGADVIGKEAASYFEGEQHTYQTVQPLFNGSEDVIYVESWQRRRDGEKRLLAWRCRTLKDAQGNVTGALSTAHDITERQRAEELLRDSEDRYRRLVELSPDAIIIHREGKIIFANPASVRLVHARDATELIGKPALDFVHPHYRQVTADRIRQVTVEGAQAPSIEGKFVRLDGASVDVEVTVIPFRYEDKPAV